jgi:DNA-directed RNA polymerase subunit omega
VAEALFSGFIKMKEATMSSMSNMDGITNPPIDELLDKAGSKYSLVLYAAKRARQINAYYSQLGEGLLEYVGPLVETYVHEKPLSIALREINEGLLTIENLEPKAQEATA